MDLVHSEKDEKNNVDILKVLEILTWARNNMSAQENSNSRISTELLKKSEENLDGSKTVRIVEKNDTVLESIFFQHRIIWTNNLFNKNFYLSWPDQETDKDVVDTVVGRDDANRHAEHE